MKGVGAGKFDPNGTTSRAMLVTILWRLEGEPTAGEAQDFSDVPSGTWYSEAVRWAASKEIVTGYKGSFNPGDPVTREQFAAIMWRYARYKGIDVSADSAELQTYADAELVSEWARPAMQWACGYGLIQGIPSGDATYLRPSDSATRVQTAAIFCRFLSA